MAKAQSIPPGVSFRDLEFAKIPCRRQSSAGNSYVTWEATGLPKIPQKFLNCVVYLYPTEEDAKAGTNFGGTGFIVSVPSVIPGQAYMYAITNWHVACQGSPVLRINTVDGGHDIFAFDEVQWQFDPRFDIAAIGFPLKDNHVKAHIPLQGLISPSIVKREEIGPGDDVFMVGRFVDHDGGARNVPAVRFGNISINPTPIEQENGVKADSYCIDLHSRTGYSGSPVFVYRTPGYDLGEMLGQSPEDQAILMSGVNFLMLLGIHFAQFPEMWEVTDKGQLKNESKEPLLTDGKYIRGLSGMTCVLPAWQIAEVLNLKIFKDGRDQNDALLSADTSRPISEAAPSAGGITAPPPDPASDDSTHREDFNSLLGAAAQKQKPDAQT